MRKSYKEIQESFEKHFRYEKICTSKIAPGL